MTTYRAPLRDQRFVLHELLEVGQLCALPGCRDATPDLIDAVLEEAAKLCENVLLPLHRVGDEVGCAYENGVVRTPPGFEEAFDAFVEGGWMGLAADPEHGGQGLPRTLKLVVDEMVCSAIIAGLASLGVKAEYKPINDVLVDGAKISGSAQMRRWGVVLQHGTLILDLDRDKMYGALRTDPDKKTRVTSLAEAMEGGVHLAAVKEALVAGFGEVLGSEFRRGSLTETERARIDELVREKYGNDDWNLKR